MLTLRLRNRKGFSMAELGVVIGIIAVIIASVALIGSGMTVSARKSNALNMITKLRDASVMYRSDANGGSNFVGVSLSALQTRGYITNLDNPFGGAITVAPNTADDRKLDITITKIPSQSVGDDLAASLSKITEASAYTDATKTLAVTFGG